MWVLSENLPDLTLLTVFSNICAALSSRLSKHCTPVSQPQPDEWLRLRRDCKILSLLSNTSMQIVRPLQVTQMHMRNSVSLFFSIALPPSLLTSSPIFSLIWCYLRCWNNMHAHVWWGIDCMLRSPARCTLFLGSFRRRSTWLASWEMTAWRARNSSTTNFFLKLRSAMLVPLICLFFQNSSSNIEYVYFTTSNWISL